MRGARPKVALAAIAVATLAIAGCAESSRDDNPAGSPNADATFVFGTAGEPKVLDPAMATDGESFRMRKARARTARSRS